ncbi:MAG: porin [Deltaproteobacteria bacterium]|nr:porin [Deltaproteobacteria bacterium]
MKKSVYLALAATLASLSLPTSLLAKDSKAGGVEFSGNVDVVTGWQHDDGASTDGPAGAFPRQAGGSCSFGAGGLGCNAADGAGAGSGQLGDFRGLAAPNRDTYNFYLDQVELDLQKSFGENIRLRADLDFGRFLSGTGRVTQTGQNFNLEQGYVTTNLPFGKGIELMVGRFNAPIGLESVDRADNMAVSFSNVYRYLRPHNLTGAKAYYAFNDNFDWSLYVVNNLIDVISTTVGTDSAIPSYGTRFGFTWGSVGKESTVGFSYAGGPEQFGNNAHLTNILDLDFNIHIGDKFTLGGEGIYRQDNVTSAFAGFPNSKGFGGFLLLGFSPSDTWNIYFRYGYLHDVNPTAAYTGVDQQINDFSLGAGYQITDGAKVKVEYRLDLHNYSAAAAAALTGNDRSSLQNALSAEFAYNF